MQPLKFLKEPAFAEMAGVIGALLSFLLLSPHNPPKPMDPFWLASILGAGVIISYIALLLRYLYRSDLRSVGHKREYLVLLVLVTNALLLLAGVGDSLVTGANGSALEVAGLYLAPPSLLLFFVILYREISRARRA